MGLTSINLILLLWVLLANRKVAIRDDDDPENKTTGHIYDGIEEYDNPLPKWWFYLFVGSMIFTLFYLILYPGLGSFKGLRGWTSVNQLEYQQKQALEQYQNSYGVYSKMTVVDLADEPRAMKMASRIFDNNCAVCHGADAGGALGFPNLTDNDWLYGGTPEKIKETIMEGRAAAMPAWAGLLGEKGINEVTQYVLSLSGQEHDATLVDAGQTIFANSCVACHGQDGRGSHANGAPNLTDDIWLYEGTPAGIRQTLRAGRNGNMPAQKDRLREDKIHLLTAYVYSLSKEN
ncbi:cytochrome-c oxidase, cbb3-type subunit III [Candidatus Endobugula sertula]|uniref:Cbb3-type cytochrome c oxidase subunit n=1 Tax=Candidatus Endobugula sertula TaxID=62101 RepID=A0A1D2QRM4_9GAMM|nr:cytochrome-c oxidase, cbb3-type subunit III [Candidatus Endobugula sertula]